MVALRSLPHDPISEMSCTEAECTRSFQDDKRQTWRQKQNHKQSKLRRTHTSVSQKDESEGIGSVRRVHRGVQENGKP